MPIIRQVMPTVMANHIIGVQPMMGNVGSIFTKTIGGHSFNPKYWPHVKQVSYSQLFEAERWCYDNIKGRYWRSQGLHFAFKREADYMVFLLKWS